mmetsp:Transcript_5394/g.13105  ORF Transcript_5394/g.13105 Transcript_5394/m.13105 type:complete len:381 (-) Transcript_5394:558-1700(-)
MPIGAHRVAVAQRQARVVDRPLAALCVGQVLVVPVRARVERRVLHRRARTGAERRVAIVAKRRARELALAADEEALFWVVGLTDELLGDAADAIDGYELVREAVAAVVGTNTRVAVLVGALRRHVRGLRGDRVRQVVLVGVATSADADVYDAARRHSRLLERHFQRAQRLALVATHGRYEVGLGAQYRERPLVVARKTSIKVEVGHDVDELVERVVAHERRPRRSRRADGGRRRRPQRAVAERNYPRAVLVGAPKARVAQAVAHEGLLPGVARVAALAAHHDELEVAEHELVPPRRRAAKRADAHLGAVRLRHADARVVDAAAFAAGELVRTGGVHDGHVAEQRRDLSLPRVPHVVGRQRFVAVGEAEVARPRHQRQLLA